MANSEQTKRALAEGLKTALRSQEFDQITVADITECSEVSRNTFYYHFRDKQELVDWIFHTDLGPVLRDSRPDAPGMKPRLSCWPVCSAAGYSMPVSCAIRVRTGSAAVCLRTAARW